MEGNPRERPRTLSQDESELLWTVRRAAEFLGVSPQTVYLWVERKRIPHFRIMGRNIRFLRSDLQRFRGSFKNPFLDTSGLPIHIPGLFDWPRVDGEDFSQSSGALWPVVAGRHVRDAKFHKLL